MARILRRSLLVPAAIVAVVASSAARTPSGAQATGTIAGVVVTDTPAPQPVRRATVRVSTGANGGTRQVGTDDDGRFVLTALPAGNYVLWVSRPGYVTTFYGSSRPGRGPGVPVAVADGARVDVTMKILPGATIAGTITDARGNGMPGIAVHALELATGVTGPPARARTDDRGDYRIFSLPPGDYLVAAIPRLGPAGGSRAISGDVLGVSDAEVQWARSAAGVGFAGAIPPAGHSVSYSPVFYPGVADASAAAVVKAIAGQERSGVNITARIVPTTTIAGRTVDADGLSTAATVSMFPRRRDRPAQSDLLVSSGALVLPRSTGNGGEFAIQGVTPGEYTLVARSGTGARATAGSPPPGATLWSVMDLTVDGNDRLDLMLRLLPGQRIAGTVAFDRSTQAPRPDPAAIEVTLLAAGSYLGAASTPRAVVDAAGAFRFSSVPPGTYLLRAAPPRSAPGGASWALKSAMLGDRDLADRPIDVTPGNADLEKIVVTFTDRAAEISGRLLDSRNRPVTRYSIVVFTTDRDLWRPHARRIRSIRPATDGSFLVPGLPAGSYAIVGVADLDESALDDPAFLDELLSAAYRVTLSDGERRRQDLRVGSLTFVSRAHVPGLQSWGMFLETA